MEKDFEIWKDIPWCDSYSVSSLGRIFSKKSKIFLKPKKHWKGYLIVDIKKDGILKHHRIHRIVIETFIGKSNLQVNHKNGNKEDNSISNLEYVTQAENLRHARYVLKSSYIKQKQVCKKSIQGEFLGKYESHLQAAKENSIDRGSISACCRGEIKTAGGFIWENI